ncbi:MAG: hypothetical protein KJ732_08095 [Candidatus Margulisbacteria bacterium]|nr:hypothetical protein [Candidatus Margulisiibacteriota bacterium]
MLRTIAIILILALASQCLALQLDKNAVWAGSINLTEDIIVPSGLSLTIAPGTKVFTNGNKIISFGTLNILGEEDKRVDFYNTLLTNSSTIEVIKVKPYDVDTEILKEEFNVFKAQYAILWSLLFASTFILIEAR